MADKSITAIVAAAVISAVGGITAAWITATHKSAGQAEISRTVRAGGNAAESPPNLAAQSPARNDAGRSAAESELSKTLLGTWFSDETQSHPEDPQFKTRIVGRTTYVRSGDFNLMVTVQAGHLNAPYPWRLTCIGVGSGAWSLNERTVTSRLTNISFKMLGVSKDGRDYGPEEARSQGYSCDLLSTLVQAGQTSDDEILDIGENSMRMRSSGKVTAYSRSEPQIF